MNTHVSRSANLLVIALVAFLTFFTGYHEGYLGLISPFFWVVLVAGIAVSIWLACNISTKRLVALVLSIFMIEYVKETLGVVDGFWTYAQSSYVFGVWAWVIGGLVAFAMGRLLVARIVASFSLDIPKGANVIPLIIVTSLGLVLLGPYRALAGPEFWVFYSVLLVVAYFASRKIEFSDFVGLVLAAVVVGAMSEYAGSARSGIWIFTYDPDFPPLFLLIAGWPLEITAQYFLSGILANEFPNGSPPNSPAVQSDPAPAALKHPTKEKILMVPRTKYERQLRVVMLLSGFTYLTAGFAFAIVPVPILQGLNAVSNYILPNLPLTPLNQENFWVALSFSMMMTITCLCFMAAHNVRKNKGYVFVVIVSKAASTVSALVFFLAHEYFLSYLVIVGLDGSLCVITLFFYLRANRAFFLAQTAYLREKPKELKETEETTVVVLTGDDKFKLMDEVLERANFFGVLDDAYDKSGRTKPDFAVVIKPNFMFMHSKKDFSTFTDPELVEALVDRLVDRGYTNVTLVEAQSTYGNYYENREVLSVAKYIGYSTDKNYRIVDLTEEKVPYDYGGRLGDHVVGPTWRDADFRVSFAKNKTHIFCHYTLTLKNIYGTLPIQNKLKEYHSKREYDWPTIETLKHFKVHFGIVDAFSSADGHFGVIADPQPNLTKTIIAGENLMAVDWVGARKMGLDPDDPQIGRFLQLAVEAFGKPRINWVGDMTEYKPWKNVSDVFVKSLDIIEESYAFANWWFGGLTAMDGYFRFKLRAWPIRLLRLMLAPFKRLIYKYDKLT